MIYFVCEELKKFGKLETEKEVEFNATGEKITHRDDAGRITVVEMGYNTKGFLTTWFRYAEFHTEGDTELETAIDFSLKQRGYTENGCG